MPRILALVLAVMAGAGAAPAGAGAAPAGASAPPRVAHAVFAGGCFWGMEAVFDALAGVTNVVAGFSGGGKDSARYLLVSSGMTGHAESVDITYDPTRISYAQLLRVYFMVAHDPTELDRQGPDSGSQYRSAIFFTTEAQRRAAEAAIAELAGRHVYRDPIVTKVVPFTGFYPAEAYHQHYVARHPTDPYVVYNDAPKLKELRRRFPDLVKEHA